MGLIKKTKRDSLFLALLISLGALALSGCDSPSAKLRVQDATYSLGLGKQSENNEQKVKDCVLTLSPSDKAAFDGAKGENVFLCRADRSYHAAKLVVAPLEGDPVQVDLLYKGLAPGPDRYWFDATPTTLLGWDSVSAQWMLEQQSSKDSSSVCDRIDCGLYFYSGEKSATYSFELCTAKNG
jgi:hypothetical protein